MSARERLHQLVDNLDEDRLDGAVRLLESLKDPVLAALLTAEEDDEPLTEDERRRLEAAEAGADRGEFLPWSEVRERLG